MAVGHEASACGSALVAAVRAPAHERSDAGPTERSCLLRLRDGEFYRTVRIDDRAGLRYPRLERIEGTPDRLQALLAPR